MDIKYQVFISSTYQDLKEERDQVIKAVLEMGHFPVGMEMFSAGNDEQWKYIAKRIDDSDYYVVIVAHRYGSLAGKISYTEKEYDYAVSQGIPVLGFIIDSAATWPANKMDTKPSDLQALNLFKAKIKHKAHKLWKSSDDLYGKVGISLNNQIKETPRIGWIRTPKNALAPPHKPAGLTSKQQTAPAKTRATRIFKLLYGDLLHQQFVTGEVNFEDENEKLIEVKLPIEEGPFNLHFCFSDEALDSISQYLYVAIPTDSFNKNELFANMRIILNSVIRIYKYQADAVCRFIIVTNEDLTSQKGSLLESFERLKIIAKHPNSEATSLEIWDNSELRAKEAQLGIILD